MIEQGGDRERHNIPDTNKNDQPTNAFMNQAKRGSYKGGCPSQNFWGWRIGKKCMILLFRSTNSSLTRPGKKKKKQKKNNGKVSNSNNLLSPAST